MSLNSDITLRQGARRENSLCQDYVFEASSQGDRTTHRCLDRRRLINHYETKMSFENVF